MTSSRCFFASSVSFSPDAPVRKTKARGSQKNLLSLFKIRGIEVIGGKADVKGGGGEEERNVLTVQFHLAQPFRKPCLFGKIDFRFGEEFLGENALGSKLERDFFAFSFVESYLVMLLQSGRRDEGGKDHVSSVWIPGRGNLRLGHVVGAGEGVEKREPSYTVGGNAN